MLGLVKYSHLSTKIRAMTGKMLKKNDYEQLMAKKSVKEVALYLKNNTYYHEVLEGINENNIHRGHLESLLSQALIQDVLKIDRYLKGSDKSIYRFVYMRQVIDDLKKMMRVLQVGKSLEQMDKSFFFINKYSVIDFDVLLKADNFNTWLDGLSDTGFYKLLKPLIIDDHKIDLFSAEMILDMYFYKQLVEQDGDLPSRTEKEMFFLGTAADFGNILWIYRGKKYYKLSKEMLYRYLVPFNYKLKPHLMNQMIDAKDDDTLLKLLNQSAYKFLFNDNPIEWDKRFQEYLAHGLKKYIRMSPFSIAPIIGYVVIKQIEIANITTIIEGIRYGEDLKTIEHFMINT